MQKGKASLPKRKGRRCDEEDDKTDNLEDDEKDSKGTDEEIDWRND